MARTYVNYFFNPILMIITFIVEDDFHKNVHYFIISELIALFMVFFGAVYNEYIILCFCGLEYDTKYAISQRALERETTYSLHAEKEGYIIKNDQEEKILIEMI